MKHFEASGLWFPSDDPTNAVGGTLKFDDEGLHLTLLGSFRQGWSPDVERYPIIHGIVGESPYGAYVTLIDCFRNQSSFNMIGVTSEKIRCKKAVVGNFHLPEGPSRFESLYLDFSYLTEWVGQGGMTVEPWLAADHTFVVKYHKPENVRFSYGDKTLSLCFNFNGSSNVHRSILTESARLAIEPVGDLTPTSLGKEHVRTLQNLLSFATDTPNDVAEIAYLGKEDDRGLTPQVNLIAHRVFQLETKKDSLYPLEMVFDYAATKNAKLNIFQNWIIFTNKHSTFCKVYFALTYAEPKYLDDKFAKVVSAFTLLCTNRGEPSDQTKSFVADAERALTEQFTDEEREFLNHLIPTEPEVEMPIHLLRLLRENGHLMGQLIEDFPSFVRSVSLTLAFIKRRVEGERPPLKGSDLFNALEKIKMLTKILVLKELGFGEEDVKTFIERNQWFNHLKMVKRGQTLGG